MELKTLEESLNEALELKEELEVGNFVQSKKGTKSDYKLDGVKRIVNLIRQGNSTWYEVQIDRKTTKRIPSDTVEQWIKGTREAGDPNLKVGTMIMNPKGSGTFGDQFLAHPVKILKVFTQGDTVTYEVKNHDRKVVRIKSENAKKA